MCIADVESELFRDCSRGIEGGAFMTATLLNRKKAKTCKGKENIDALKDFINIKAEAMFNPYFISKFHLDPSVDNTPPFIKTASQDRKISYLHAMVIEALKDLLPYFQDCTGILPDLTDFPVRQLPTNSSEDEVSTAGEESTANETSMLDAVKSASVIPDLLQSVPADLEAHFVSHTNSGKIYVCNYCDFVASLKSVVTAHMRGCSKAEVSSNVSSQSQHIMDPEVDKQTTGLDMREDYFWNYKNGELFIDSIFKLMQNYEKYGHGLGLYVISKVLLPFLQSLGHSNYSNSVHRFICKVLTSSTPREALLLIWERFFNRTGREGGNIFKDRRIEFRIRSLKLLIGNLGPNLNNNNINKGRIQINMTHFERP